MCRRSVLLTWCSLAKVLLYSSRVFAKCSVLALRDAKVLLQFVSVLIPVSICEGVSDVGLLGVVSTVDGVILTRAKGMLFQFLVLLFLLLFVHWWGQV